MSKNQGHHLLFFSQRCPHSQRFLKELSNTPYYHNFIHINVDEGKYKIPANVRSTPTIIVPEFNRPLAGPEVFNWIQFKVQKAEQANPQQQQQRQFQQEQQQPNQGGPQPANGGGAGGDNIMPFSNEMAGFSDNYSLLDTAKPMEHSFSFLGQQQQSGGIPSGADVQRMAQNSRVSNDFDKAFENFQRQRDKDIPRPPPRE